MIAIKDNVLLSDFPFQLSLIGLDVSPPRVHRATITHPDLLSNLGRGGGRGKHEGNSFT